MDSFINDTQRVTGAASQSFGETLLGVAGDIFFGFIQPPEPYEPEGEGFDGAFDDVVSANPKKKKPAELRKEHDNRNKQLREGAFLGTLHLPLDHAADFAQTTRKRANEQMMLEKTEAQLERMCPGITGDGPLANLKQSELKKKSEKIKLNVPRKVQKEKDKEKKTQLEDAFVKKVLDMKKATHKMRQEIAKCDQHFEQLKVDFPKSQTALDQLLDEGADINSVDQEGFTALMLAARNGHYLTVTALLQIPKLEANKLNNYSANAMHYAAMYAHHDVVFLLRRNAYQNVKKDQPNAANKWPRDLAKDETKDLQDHKDANWLKTYKEGYYKLVPEMGKKDAPDNPLYNALGMHAPESVEPPKNWKPDRWRISKIRDPACLRDEPFSEKEFMKRWDRAAKKC